MFYFDETDGKKIIKSDMLRDYDCFFTTREFVLTPSQRPDLADEAAKNRSILEKTLGGEIYTAVQTHGKNVEIVTPDKKLYENTDALISQIPNAILVMNFADCVPIILYDKTTDTGAIAHAGWRGTAAKIAAETVEKMKTVGVKPENITALIGPSIGKCCFETGKDVFEQLVENKNDKDLYEEKGGKYYVDLKKINYNLLKKAGVTNIDICGYCTSCMSGLFFSYRKENGITARHSAVLKIRRNRNNVGN